MLGCLTLDLRPGVVPPVAANWNRPPVRVIPPVRDGIAAVKGSQRTGANLSMRLFPVSAT